MLDNAHALITMCTLWSSPIALAISYFQNSLHFWNLWLRIANTGMECNSRYTCALFCIAEHVIYTLCQWPVDWDWSGSCRTNPYVMFLLVLCVCWWCSQPGGGDLERVQIFVLAKGLKIEFFGTIQYRKQFGTKFFANLVYTCTLPIHPSTWLGDLWFKVVLLVPRVANKWYPSLS